MSRAEALERLGVANRATEMSDCFASVFRREAKRFIRKAGLERSQKNGEILGVFRLAAGRNCF